MGYCIVYVGCFVARFRHLRFLLVTWQLWRGTRQCET